MASAHQDQAFAVPILGGDSEVLIELNQKLSTLGINDTIRLPTIVVIGDQSTGKSSLIEKISTIQVPKAAGLCTRCPIAINLSGGHATKWECTVYAEEHYAYDSTVKQKRITKANPLGPWKAMMEPFTEKIATTRDPTELINLIQKAQDIVLDPTRHQAHGTSSVGKLEGFSPNTIRIDISVSSACPGLSFVDLPGVIANTSKDSPPYYVDLVKSLARTYAEDENNIIMLTLPANHDINNSNSYSIVQNSKAQAHTMAVFTKIDVARDEERATIINEYFSADNEEEEEFEYGHHIVMLRENADSLDGAINPEDAFFSRDPWSTMSAATRRRLGVSNLIEFVRSILLHKTAQALPENLTKVSAKIALLDNELQQMPKPPNATELPYELQNIVDKLDGSMKQLFSGSQIPANASSRSKLVKSMQAFKARILREKPVLVIRSEYEKEQLHEALGQIRRVSEDKTGNVAGKSGGEHKESTPTKNSKVKQDTTRQGGYRFTLEEIQEVNEQHYQSYTPGAIELKAVDALHLKSVSLFEDTLEHFVREIMQVIDSEILDCVNTVFKSHAHLPIYAEIDRIVREFLTDVVQAEWARLRSLCKAEMNHPLTLDEERMRLAEEVQYKQKMEKRNEIRLEVERTVQKAENLASKKKVKEITLEEIGPDPWETEIRMVAKTNAYYEIASHRFIDCVCQNIFANLIPSCRDSLVNHIRACLGLNDIDNYRDSIVKSMTEASEREAKRRRILSELDRLKKGRKYIRDVAEQFGRRALARNLSAANSDTMDTTEP